MPGSLAIASAVSFVVSGACLVRFFTTGNERWGRANDATISFAAIGLVPGLVSGTDRVGHGSIGVAAAILGVSGLLFVSASSALTAAGRLDWRRSARLGAVGFGGFGVWIIFATLASFEPGGLPTGIGLVGAVTVAVTAVASLAGFRFVRAGGMDAIEHGGRPGTATVACFVGAFACYPVWTAMLGIALLRAA